MIYDTTNLEQSPHFSPEDRQLYWLNEEHTILTDGYKLYDYSPSIGVQERQYAEVPTNHQRIDYELIKSTIDEFAQADATRGDIVSFLTSKGFSDERANWWIDLFIDAVAEFTLQPNSFDNCKSWVEGQLDDGKSSDKVTEMLIGMLVFTDIIKTNIVVYKDNLPYKQVCII